MPQSGKTMAKNRDGRPSPDKSELMRRLLKITKKVDGKRRQEIGRFDMKTEKAALGLIEEGNFHEAEVLVRSAIRDQKEVGKGTPGPVLKVFENILIFVLTKQGKIGEAEETLERLGKRKTRLMVLNLIHAYGAQPREEYAGRARLLFDKEVEKYDARVEAWRKGVLEPQRKSDLENEKECMAAMCVEMEILYGRVNNLKGREQILAIAKRHGWTDG